MKPDYWLRDWRSCYQQSKRDCTVFIPKQNCISWRDPQHTADSNHVVRKTFQRSDVLGPLLVNSVGFTSNSSVIRWTAHAQSVFIKSDVRSHVWSLHVMQSEVYSHCLGTLAASKFTTTCGLNFSLTTSAR